MANTVTVNGRFIEITDIDSDWTLNDGSGLAGTDWAHMRDLRVESIRFDPAAADDACSIRDGSDSGPRLFFASGTDSNDQKVQYYHGKSINPYLDYSDGTYTADSKVTIEVA